MASSIDICNLALSHLGDEATVSSIDPPEGSAQADHCAAFYPIARNNVLASHAWSCATKRETLALLSLTPPDAFVYAYSVPSTCLRALRVMLPGDTDDSNGQEFEIEAQSDGTLVLYTNAADASLVYIAGITDTTRFTPGMVTAIARLLAAYVAGPLIKGSEGMKVAAAQMQMYLRVELPQAQSQDASARRRNAYKTFTPESISARA